MCALRMIIAVRLALLLTAQSVVGSLPKQIRKRSFGRDRP